MKKLFSLLICAALTGIFCCVVTSCSSSSDSASIGDITFKKANIAGAKMLALAGASTGTRADGENDGPTATAASILYKVNDNGILEEVTYTIEVKDADGKTAQEVQARMRLDIANVLPIGDKWLWLKSCKYVCPTFDEITDADVRKAIENLLYQYLYGTGDYLVRLSDGALFQWGFNEGCPGDNMSDLVQPQHLYGLYEPYGKDILACGAQNVLFHLKDKGNTLEAINVTPTNVYAIYVMPTSEGYMGTRLDYNPGSGLYLIMADGYQVVPIDIAEPADDFEASYLCELVSVDGKLYIGRNTYKIRAGVFNTTLERTEFLKVEMAGGVAKAEEVVASIDVSTDFTKPQNTGLSVPVSKGETFSWIAEDSWNSSIAHIYTFAPKAGTLTRTPLPEHYPHYATTYVDGVAYVVDIPNNALPSSFWRCDLSQSEAEEIPLIWGSDIQAYSSQIVMNSLMMGYSASSKSLLGQCMLLDGRKLSIRADVEGANRGKVKVLLEGEQTAGKVVSVMVRLN